MELKSDEEKKLYNAKTPKEYINISVEFKDKISKGRKRMICIEWLKNHPEYSIDNIKYERNKHPYWKDKKHSNSRDNALHRSQIHDYRIRDYQEWKIDEIKKFIKMNKKVEDKYIYTDVDLAKEFKRSIYSTQYMRRKYNKAYKILLAESKKISKKNLLNLMVQTEKILKKKLDSLNK